MLNHSAAYDEAIVAPVRRQFVRAIFDLYDPDMVIGAVSASSEEARLSRLDQVTDRGPDSSREISATLEWNRWILDGTESIAPDSASGLSGQVGWVGGVLSGEDGAFETPPWLEVSFTGVSTLQAVTVLFSDAAVNGYGTDFTLSIYSGSTVLYTAVVSGNTDTLVVVDGFTVQQPTKIRLTINAWSEGSRRPRVPRLLPGLYETWTGRDIQTVDIYTEVTFSGLALPYSTCGLTIEDQEHRFDPYAPNSVFESIEDRQAIVVDLGLELEGGAVEWLPAGTYYQQSQGWSTKGGLTFSFSLIDICGALTKRKFTVPGTLPTTLEGWVAAIMASLGVGFTDRYIVDSDVAATALTARNAAAVTGKTCGELLRFACMATNTWPRQDIATGMLRVGPLSRVGGNRITAGNMSDWPTMTANKDVSDITFTLDSGSVTFPGNNTQSETSLSVDNPFVHTTADARKAVISCLFEYGGRSFTVPHRGNPSSECGDIQSVDTQYDTIITARLYKQQLKLEKGVMINVPSQLVQSPNDTVYNNRVVLTGSGTWTAPAAGEYRVTLIGGGTGGTGGGGGVRKRTGELTIFDPPDTTGGTGGTGGKVNIVTVTAAASQVYAYSCGAGGPGGAGGAPGSGSDRGEDGHTGSDGGNSTFGTYSSAPGTRYAAGLMSIATGEVYAQAGPDYGTKIITASYGSGGIGGKPGRNGLIYYDALGEKQVLRPLAGGTGGPGQAGCIIIEWG